MPAPTRRTDQAASRLLLATLVAGLCAGCVTSRVEGVKNATTGIEDHESVVVIATSYHKGNRTGTDFLQCMDDELDDGAQAVNVYPREKFLDDLFPWLEPRTMPQEIKDLPELLSRPGVSERINASGVRYLVWIDGSTKKTSDGGGMSCAASPAGGGCFGLVWWEDDGTYTARVWDLKASSAAGKVSTHVHGSSMVPALILPLPFIARTETAACKELAGELREFIVQEDLS
ncbi:MAG: hypothetical protein KJ040_04375 [Gammaproteobacteria bacterium]|nr:hypothetical protein [Gammaproteobacteria bacterium]